MTKGLRLSSGMNPTPRWWNHRPGLVRPRTKTSFVIPKRFDLGLFVRMVILLTAYHHRCTLTMLRRQGLGVTDTLRHLHMSTINAPTRCLPTTLRDRLMNTGIIAPRTTALTSVTRLIGHPRTSMSFLPAMETRVIALRNTRGHDTCLLRITTITRRLLP